MSFSLNDVSIAARVGAGLLVTAGAAGMSFVAVAMASARRRPLRRDGHRRRPGDDLRVPVRGRSVQSRAGGGCGDARRGPGAVHVRGMDVLAGGRRTGRLLPGRRGGARAARARRGRRDDGDRLRAGRPRAAERRQERGRAGALQIALALQLALLVLVAVWAAIYLARRPQGGRARRAAAARCCSRREWARSPAASCWRPRGAHGPLPALAVAVAALAVLAEELVLRGVLQRSVSTSRIRAAAISTAVGVITALLSLSLSAQGAAAVGARSSPSRPVTRRPRSRMRSRGASRRRGYRASSSSGSPLSRLSPSERLEYDDHDAVFPTFAYVTPECCASGRGGGVGNGSDRVMRCRPDRAGHDAVPAPRRLIRGHLFGRRCGGLRKPGRRGLVRDGRWRRERAVGYRGHGRQQRRRGHGW